ncbi:PR-1-like protein [Ascoidea rubescens DSM 1968]|uniref:PR-1-like protein n=1 Tax=Ascoidea rubescens DSM 1968 TaxID=1344418 RepID=A0A1D2V8I0_9ASCO|nr:PR-1-like protein [Ascoidea rubescens DSM 1968]ODV57959.1 PR-1-like protein [Ascoidea rubescens DSM 1968]
MSRFALEMLRHHNQKRQLHQDVPDLVWNQTVYDFAQSYADSYGCPEDLELVHSMSADYGENLAAGFRNVSAVVDVWYDEIADFDYSRMDEYDDGSLLKNVDPERPIGHFTQLIWKSTTQLGCAYKRCARYLYYTCNYYPAGNLRIVGGHSYTANIAALR